MTVPWPVCSVTLCSRLVVSSAGKDPAWRWAVAVPLRLPSSLSPAQAPGRGDALPGASAAHLPVGTQDLLDRMSSGRVKLW